MVYAAWRKRIPAALAEADAHLGLANRLAAPFARRVFLAYPVEGGRAASTASSVGRCRRGSRCRAEEARAAVRAAGRRADAARLRRQPGGGSAERDRARRVRRRRAGRSPPLRRAVPRRARRARLAAGVPAARRGPTTSARRSTPCDLVLARAGGSVWEVAAAGQARGARPLAERHRRPPDEERALLRAGGRRRRRAGAGDRPRPRGRARPARRRRPARRDGRGDARAPRSPTPRTRSPRS